VRVRKDSQLIKPKRLLNWLSDSSHPSLPSPKRRRNEGGPFKYARVSTPALILDGLCLHVTIQFSKNRNAPRRRGPLLTA
jgi:hypothetical protein